MREFGHGIKIPDLPEQPIASKEILWPIQPGFGNLPTGDSSRFPDIQAIKTRKSAEQPAPLFAFKKAVSNALKRVLILDGYFLEPEKGKGNRQSRIDQILMWMPETMQANDIRILTNALEPNGNVDIGNDVKKQFQEHAEVINSYRLPGAGKCTIDMKFTLDQTFDCVHDRFAIIDDELWHFGATVGGFHSQVNAATRGWRASEHGAKVFFESAWAGDSRMGKKKK